MLKSTLIHPPLIGALAAAGHGSTVLIADGNYPVATGTRPGVPRIHLNLTPGLLTVTQILEAVAATVPIESAAVMVPADGPTPQAHATYRAALPEGTPWRELGRFDFYDECRTQDLAVVIASGDQRLYANLLLTIGVVDPD